MSTGVVGIDLGTTFSAIAAINRHGVPEVLANAEGEHITPSVVLFENDDVVVGNYAKQAATVYPDQVVEFVKRHMGDPEWRFRYRDRVYTPEDLSAYILAKLKADAEQRLGTRVDKAVITVPAYFNDLQRRATLAAGERAGLHVLKLLNEPTAAAYAYGLHQRDKKSRLLLFDLGGGTFDVTLLDVNGNQMDTIATHGDNWLGGKDWDDRIIDYVANEFITKHGVDPRTDLATMHDLRAKAVSAKLSLSRRPTVNIFPDFQGRTLMVSLSRETFEHITRPLLDRVEALTRQMLAEANCAPTDVDVVLLAGGSTRMPMVRELISRVFQKEPSTDINPDVCVSMGAAIMAAIEAARIDGKDAPIDLRTQDVTSHSLGLAVVRDGQLHTSKIIRRNTRIPAEVARDDYTTTHDNQTTLDLWLVQGEHDDPLQNVVLGHFEFYGIPARAADDTRLSITFRYNANGIVEVEAMDLSSGGTLPHRMATNAVTLADLAAGRSPMQLAILLDASGSMYGPRLREAQSATEDFLRRLLAPDDGGRPSHRTAALVTFPGGARVRLTDDLELLRRGLAATIPIGSTPLAEGLAVARNLVRPRPGTQRVFVIVTDGLPDDTEAAVLEADRIKAQGVRILVIAVGEQADKRVLGQIASSPADLFRCGEAVELQGLLANLATEIS